MPWNCWIWLRIRVCQELGSPSDTKYKRSRRRHLTRHPKWDTRRWRRIYWSVLYYCFALSPFIYYWCRTLGIHYFIVMYWRFGCSLSWYVLWIPAKFANLERFIESIRYKSKSFEQSPQPENRCSWSFWIVLKRMTIQFVYARAIWRRLGSGDWTNRPGKLCLELTILCIAINLFMMIILTRKYVFCCCRRYRHHPTCHDQWHRETCAEVWLHGGDGAAQDWTR
jgi:hypothetical protein